MGQIWFIEKPLTAASRSKMETSINPRHNQGEKNRTGKWQISDYLCNYAINQVRHSCTPGNPGFGSTEEYRTMAEQQERNDLDQTPATPRPVIRRGKAKRPRESESVGLRYPRKRALTACGLCRTKKTKCDNVRPTCGSCASIGAICSFDDAQKDHSSYVTETPLPVGGCGLNH